MVVLNPCGVCRERLAVHGPEVLVAVADPLDPTVIVWKRLKVVLPDYWITAFQTSSIRPGSPDTSAPFRVLTRVPDAEPCAASQVPVVLLAEVITASGSGCGLLLPLQSRSWRRVLAESGTHGAQPIN